MIDIKLNAKHFINAEKVIRSDPNRVLWLQVLFQALEDLNYRPNITRRNVAYNTLIMKARMVRTSARNWFFSKYDGIGSFIWVCNVLDLNCQGMQKRALFLIERGYNLQ